MMEDGKTKETGTTALTKIRPELNLEKWDIWQPSHSKTSRKSVTLQRGEGKVTASYNALYGPLTTKDQKAYYGLIKLWEEKRSKAEPVIFNLRELAKILNISWSGSKTIEAIKQSLLRLRGTLFVWENAFWNSERKDIEPLLDTFNILADFKLAKRIKAEDKEEIIIGYYEFNKRLLYNLLHNHTKPLLFDVVINFKSEIAQLLYTHLDLILANQTHYERKTRELFFEDLRLEGKEYIKPSVRKRQLEKALRELQGVQLSTGYIVSITLERTKDKKDWKLVVYKSTKKPQPIESRGEKEAEKPLTKEDYLEQQELKIEQIESQLNSLPEDQQQAIREKVINRIYEEHPILKGREHWDLFRKLLNQEIEKELNLLDQQAASTEVETGFTEPENL